MILSPDYRETLWTREPQRPEDPGLADLHSGTLELRRLHEHPQSEPIFGFRGCDEALFSEKKGFFSEKGGGNSVNQGLGKDFYRKGNSVKRFGPFTEPPDSEN